MGTIIDISVHFEETKEHKISFNLIYLYNEFIQDVM